MHGQAKHKKLCYKFLLNIIMCNNRNYRIKLNFRFIVHIEFNVAANLLSMTEEFNVPP